MLTDTSMKKLTLGSGNVFYYYPESSDLLAFGFIVSPDKEFVGGYMCLEADRKYAVFSKLNNVTVAECSDEEGFQILRACDRTKFAEKLGAASRPFTIGFDLMVNDLGDCNGTDSTAQSCDERMFYYEVVGCQAAFKSSKSFFLGLFVANHVSIFSWNNFRETFFRGKEQAPEKDDVVSDVESWKKYVYVVQCFKAPAAYVRAFISSTE